MNPNSQMTTEYDRIYIIVCIIVYIITVIYIYNEKRKYAKIMNDKIMNDKIMNDKIMNDKIMNDKIMNKKILNEKIMNEKIMNERIQKINNTLKYIIDSNNDMMTKTQI